MEEVKEEKSFKDLGVKDELAKACNNLGWKNPTKNQIEAIPFSLEGKDIIGLAQLDRVKLEPLLFRFYKRFLKILRPSLLVSSRPHVNLRFKLLSSSKLWGLVLVSSVLWLVGGVDLVQQSIALGKRPHIVVATPGRLVDHLSNTKGFSLRTLKYLVLDGPIDC